MNKPLIYFLVLMVFLGKLSAAEFDRVDSDLKNYDSKVENMRSEFAKTVAVPRDLIWVKLKLTFMVEVDQYMRSMWQIPSKSRYTSEETEYFRKQFLPRNDQIDSENTSDLKSLLNIYPWFTISEFGTVPDSQAWLIVQHADLDPQFQKEMLEILTQLLPKKETNPKNYAYLFDRVAASWNDPSKRTLQRYGTQGQCTAPQLWEPILMEEPEHIDQRRASVGLDTLAEYKLMMKQFCP